MAKSYFAILGVSPNASAGQIRSAYRRLAKEFHPDRYGGDSGPFREIQEAYAVLGDSDRRRDYEQSMRPAPRRSSPRPSAYPPAEPLLRPDRRRGSSPESYRSIDPFEEVFEWFWDHFSGRDRSMSGRMQHLEMEVPLTPEQARHGGHVKVMVPARIACPACDGRGGTGFYGCRRCAGTGAGMGEVPVSIAFPPGLTEDHAVSFSLERFGLRHFQVTVRFSLNR